MKPKRVRLVAILTIAAAVLAGCTAQTVSPTAHVVTSKESELLAISRFANFNAGTRTISTVLNQSGTELKLLGWVDYANGAGYVEVTGAFESQALLWTSNTVGIIASSPDSDGFPRLPIPDLDDQNWQSRPLDTSSSALDTLLAAIGNLGQDRPDNPLLLQQSGAMWLKTDKVGGVPVTVFAAPASDEPLPDGKVPQAGSESLRLWVTKDGLILRAELNLNGSWVTVDFSAEPAPSLQIPGE